MYGDTFASKISGNRRMRKRPTQAPVDGLVEKWAREGGIRVSENYGLKKRSTIPELR